MNCELIELDISLEINSIQEEAMKERFNRRYNHHNFFLRNPNFPWNTPNAKEGEPEPGKVIFKGQKGRVMV